MRCGLLVIEFHAHKPHDTIYLSLDLMFTTSKRVGAPNQRKMLISILGKHVNTEDALVIKRLQNALGRLLLRSTSSSI